MSIPDIIYYLPLVYLAVVAIPLVVIDLQQHRLPNKIVLPFLLLALVCNVAVNAVNGTWLNLSASLGFPIAVFIIGMVANYYNWLGMGDVKLLTAVMFMASIYSPLLSLWIVPVSLAIGFLVTGIQIVRKKAAESIPLGPWILITTFSVSALALVPAW